MGELIEKRDALEAVNKRITELNVGSHIFRNKVSGTIDVYGVKKWIYEIPEVHAFTSEQVIEKLQEIEDFTDHLSASEMDKQECLECIKKLIECRKEVYGNDD